MQISSIPVQSIHQNAIHQPDPPQPGAADDSKLREVFDQFVGQTFYGEMMKAMRTSVGEPAYFHGGQAEKIFQSQLDQVLSERMTEASASQFTGPMFELFQLTRT